MKNISKHKIQSTLLATLPSYLERPPLHLTSKEAG